MSAIAGILYFGGAAVEPGLIEKLTGAMKARGEDEQTHWTQGSVALGHCMLRTTPESLEEHQPVMSDDGRLVLVWDGRLDNREDLQCELASSGVIPRDNSDAELVLQSYAAWSEACPERLLGDFAFAVWDASRKRLFCARDHMGARPFYYTRNEHFFAFASEDEALLNIPGVSAKPNEELIAYFLAPAFLDFDYSRSWLEDVWLLASAQRVSVSAGGGMKLDTYWRLTAGEEASYASDQACQDAFLEVFGEAVRCRMRSIGDVSAMMSGGLDSAGVMAMTKRLLPEMPGKQFHTYSVISDHPETCIESQCILSMTRGMGRNAHFLAVPSVTGMASIDDLIQAARTKPHPVTNSILLQALMCLSAGRNGHRVMLHGATGDLAMYVPSRYPAFLLRAGKWKRAWKECRDASRNNTYLRGASPWLLLLRNVWTAFVPEWARSIVHGLRARKTRSPLAHSLIDEGFAKKLRLVERMAARERMALPPMPGIRQMHIRALQPPHDIASGLMGLERVAGQYCVELRDPWADRRVVEFFLRLPLEYKMRDGWTKYPVRAAFAADLDAKVRWRLGKEHLGWSFTCRLMDDSRGLVSQTLEHGLDAAGKYANAKMIREEYKAYCATGSDIQRKNLDDAVILDLWLRRCQN